MSAAASALRDVAPPAVNEASFTAAGWLVLVIDGLRLALPQRDVRLIELAAELQPATVADGQVIGWLPREDADPWPVYSFDGGLRLQRPAAETRRLCVFIEAGGQTTGIACDRVHALATDVELAVEPVPGCMTGIPSPLAGFARDQGGITAVLDVAALSGYIDFLREHGNGAHE